MGPNVGGNRRAALTLAEDQSVCRRVRLTVRLGDAEGCEGKRVRTWGAASKRNAGVDVAAKGQGDAVTTPPTLRRVDERSSDDHERGDKRQRQIAPIPNVARIVPGDDAQNLSLRPTPTKCRVGVNGGVAPERPPFRDRREQRSRRRMMPNDKGNRPAAPMLSEDQSMNRRVRLTARLGHYAYLDEQDATSGVRTGQLTHELATVQGTRCNRRDL
jgi:hypothetical protein